MGWAFQKLVQSQGKDYEHIALDAGCRPQCGSWALLLQVLPQHQESCWQSTLPLWRTMITQSPSSQAYYSELATASPASVYTPEKTGLNLSSPLSQPRGRTLGSKEEKWQEEAPRGAVEPRGRTWVKLRWTSLIPGDALLPPLTVPTVMAAHTSVFWVLLRGGKNTEMLFWRTCGRFGAKGLGFWVTVKQS